MLLIDGDIVVYKAGFGSQKTIRNDSELNGDVSIEPVTHAFHKVNLVLDGILKSVCRKCINSLEYGVDYRIYLTSIDKSNFRYEIAKTKEYKGNRKSSKPVHYDAIRQFMIDHWNAEVVYGMEADDKLGIEAYRDNLDYACIASIDKDLLQIPCIHYNIDTGVFIGPEVARRDLYLPHLWLENKNKKIMGYGKIWFYAQMLLGDNVDNIPGIDKYGPVKVYNTLKACNSELDMVKSTYDVYKQFYGQLAYEKYLEMTDLLWILRNLGEYKSIEIKKFLRELGEE